MKKLYDEESLMNAEINPVLFSFERADTTDDDEVTITWVSQEDPNEKEETIYEINPDSRRNIVQRIQDRLLLVYFIEEGEEVEVREVANPVLVVGHVAQGVDVDEGPHPGDHQHHHAGQGVHEEAEGNAEAPRLHPVDRDRVLRQGRPGDDRLGEAQSAMGLVRVSIRNR